MCPCCVFQPVASEFNPAPFSPGHSVTLSATHTRNPHPSRSGTAQPWHRDLTMLVLGSAPAAGDLRRVISLLCAVASSSAKGGKATGSATGMLSGTGGADVPRPPRGFGWAAGRGQLPAGGFRTSMASGTSPCCDPGPWGHQQRWGCRTLPKHCWAANRAGRALEEGKQRNANKNREENGGMSRDVPGAPPVK